jgi:hypothetical protein
MAENEEVKEPITYRFENIDDVTVKVSVLGENGSTPFNVTLTGVTWGMLEDIMSVQETSKDDPRAIFSFMNDHIDGGARVIPLNRTTSLFAAIAEYMAQVMSTQKN